MVHLRPFDVQLPQVHRALFDSSSLPPQRFCRRLAHFFRSDNLAVQEEPDNQPVTERNERRRLVSWMVAHLFTCLHLIGPATGRPFCFFTVRRAPEGFGGP